MSSQIISHNQSTILLDIKTSFTQFLQLYNPPSYENRTGDSFYIEAIKRLHISNKHTLVVEQQHVVNYCSDLATVIFEQFYKYQPILSQALTRLADQIKKSLAGDGKEDEKGDRFYVAFNYGSEDYQNFSVRELRCSKLGRLFYFKGTVTRTTEVRPQLVVGVYKCKNCGGYSRPTQQQFKYTEPKKCFGVNCDSKVWELDLQKSQFADFQKIRVQEDPSKIPPGAMPRSIDVILRNENTQKGQPGDICRFVGYLCVLPQISSMLKPGQKTLISTRNHQSRGQMMEMEGVKGIKGIRELCYRLIFVASHVVVQNNQFRDEMAANDEDQFQNEVVQENGVKQVFSQEAINHAVFQKFNEHQLKMLSEFKNNERLEKQLADSLFPSIYGQQQIKKGILLQLFSGIHKTTTKNKISIRGDLNILIVGDPSTAKSQFLKAVNKFVPRSVYTNGKTTSAAGLTATVTKDDSGNVGIEAGALMLADNGICCIDQFDKMNYSDQTAIHEAMEQQTISIAKAGVYATLNARTSILAASNPVFGRYDKSKSLKNNLNISAPIMSRFDLFFVICDQANNEADRHLSDFIINVHRMKEAALAPKYDHKSIKFFISVARKLKPLLTLAASKKLRQNYLKIRERDQKLQNSSYKVTVRQLQSMIRLSQALAKLHLDIQIRQQHVDQAYRLISTSILKLQKSSIEFTDDDLNPENGLIKNSIIKGAADIDLEREIQEKKLQKKNKNVSISYELYRQIKNRVIQLFKLTAKEQHKNGQSDEDYSEIKISQQQLIAFLLAKDFDENRLNSEEQSIQMKKIIVAVIKKLIKQQRVLMIEQDSSEPDKKYLRIHPNFSQ